MIPEKASVDTSQMIDGEVIPKYRPLHGIRRVIAIVFPAIAIILGTNRVFDLRFFVNFMMDDMVYYYLLLAFILSLAFLHIPVRQNITGTRARQLLRIDFIPFLLLFGVFIYFAWHGSDIIVKGWSRVAPFEAVVMAVIVWILIIEVVRRTAGLVLGIVVLLLSFYPLYASFMPGFLYGLDFSFLRTATYHMFSPDSAIGVLVRVYGDIVLGFIFFGAAMIATGGAKFVLDLSMSAMGRYRGGMAKVASLASAMFGSISGSAMANVITTGSVTIPAMKRAGFSPTFAGAVETAASTAGPLMPPVMGAAAFIMATFIGIPYPTIAIAAAVPAVLFYVGLLAQIDGRAAQRGLTGLPKSQLPLAWETLKRGWFFIPTFIVLIYVLFVLYRVGQAPYIATFVMIILAQIRKETRFTGKTLLQFLEKAGKAFLDVAAILTGVGLIVGALGMTGLAVSLSRELLMAAGGNMILVIFFGYVAGTILGMGMPITAAYIFLAVTIAPALTMLGIDIMAAHLFLLYVAMLSSMTPPVAICAFAASSISGAPAMKIAVTACRLGVVVFFIPFFFILEPAIILRGDIVTIVRSILTAVVGIFILASAFEGYMLGIGKLWSSVKRKTYYLVTMPMRTLLAAAGFMIVLPVPPIDIIGLIVAAVILIPTFIITRRQRISSVTSLTSSAP